MFLLCPKTKETSSIAERLDVRYNCNNSFIYVKLFSCTLIVGFSIMFHCVKDFSIFDEI